MNTWIEQLNALAGPWLAALWRASWQGGLGFLLVWMLCRAIPRLPAQAKSWLWRLAYVKLLLALFWTTPINLPVLPAQPALAQVEFSLAPFPEPVAALGKAPPIPLDPVVATSVNQPVMPETKPVSLTAPAATRPTPPPVAAPSLVRRVWPTTAAGLLMVWTAGLAWLCGRTCRDLFRARLLRKTAKPATDAGLLKTREELSREFRLGAEPAVLLSETVSSPMLLGMFRPVVVLPAALAADAAPPHLRLMLAHEMAHLKRRDLWWVWLAVAVEGGFFFHPLVWLARRQWRLTQEIACDDLVVRLTRVPAARYGEMLVGVAARNLPHRPETLLVALGLTETKSMLVKRLNAMKTIQLNPTKRMIMVTAGILAAGVVSMAPWHLTAQEPATTGGGAADAPPAPAAARDASETPPQVEPSRAPMQYAMNQDSQDGTPGASSSFSHPLNATNQGSSDGTPVAPNPGRRGAAFARGQVGPDGGGPAGGGMRGRGGFAATVPEFPAPTNVAPAHFEATVYEVELSADNLIADLDAGALEAKDETPATTIGALSAFGNAKVLYKVDQAVNLYGENITIGSSEPMVTGSNIGVRGNRMNSLSYVSVGLITRISATDLRKGLNVDLNFQLSAMTKSAVEITDGVNASRVRTVALSQNGVPRFGKPAIALTICAGDDKTPTIAYVVRYLFTPVKS